MAKSRENRQAEIYSTFKSLSPNTSWVLVAILVYGEPASSAKLIEVLKKAKIPVRGGKMWGKPEVEESLAVLTERGWVKILKKGIVVEKAIEFLLFKVAPIAMGAIHDLAEANISVRSLTSRNSRYFYYYSEATYEDAYHLSRLRLLQNKPSEYTAAVNDLQKNSSYYSYYAADAREKAADLIANFYTDFWQALDASFQKLAIQMQLYSPNRSAKMQPSAEIQAYIQAKFYADFWTEKEQSGLLDLALHHIHILLYNFSSMESASGRELAALPEPVQALYYLSVGEETQALTIVNSNPFGESHTAFYTAFSWLLHYKHNQASLQEALAFFEGKKEAVLPYTNELVYAFFLGKTGKISLAENQLERLATKVTHPLEHLLLLWIYYWLGIFPPHSVKEMMEIHFAEKSFEQAIWVNAELTHTLSLLYTSDKTIASAGEKAAKLLQKTAWQPLATLFEPPAAWENALDMLGGVAQGVSSKQEESLRELQTIWIVNFEAQEAYPKEQKRGQKGWSSGRKLKWNDLIDPKDLSHYEEADLLSINALMAYGRKVYPYSNVSEDAIEIDFAHLLYILVDHPRVYMDEKKRILLDLKRATAELSVMEANEGLLLKFDPPVSRAGYFCKKETPTRYAIYHITQEQFIMAKAVRGGVEIPQEKRSILEQQLEGLRNRVSIQSTTDLQDLNLEELVADDRPCVHLLPFGDAYKLDIYIKPFTEETYYFKPGEGLPRSILVREAGKFVCLRDINQEVANVLALIQQCPTLQKLPHEQFEWQVDDTYDALKILLELRKLLEEGHITLEHPKGEKLKLVAEASSQDLSLKLGRQRDWFEVGGSLRIDENRVIDFELLLEQIKNNSSNFIQLANGDFLALTEELKDRILAMEGMLFKRGKKMQLPTLAAGHFAELADGLEDVEADEAWRESLARIQKASNLQPQLPADFRASLRSYQLEGFNWLARLAEWGVGACLADDMGLGKTIQALAILSSRAAKGPALVIAPASVTRNWVNETNTFAPGLIPILLGGSKDTHLLSELGPGDLLLVSYGLLPFVGEELQAIEFNTIVIDEAQAIKNVNTKRAKTVFQLQGDFKLATTGTPIENNLGELWSLFRFLNPGLLGSQEAFNQKFNAPIVRYYDQAKQQQLQKLIKPFILRRRKDEVLKELPPKTEIVLSVTLSPEEAAFYEAIRRQAIKEIAEADENSRKFRVLAELTRLRQAACHPKLLRPNSKIASAKLELVQETIQEIRESGHKALVFSQFVKHLKIVEAWVKEAGIPYQYLDGSTTGKKRQAAVEAFQQGEGDLFLISLKAGGTGLNLTEADYVLHLDPWWNPAAEDQASDRAHRIGQQRPVTVYRFVSEATIEEKIISLHKEKRDLADQLLSGTNQAGQLSVDQILELIQD